MKEEKITCTKTNKVTIRKKFGQFKDNKLNEFGLILEETSKDTDFKITLGKFVDDNTQHWIQYIFREDKSYIEFKNYVEYVHWSFDNTYESSIAHYNGGPIFSIDIDKVIIRVRTDEANYSEPNFVRHEVRQDQTDTHFTKLLYEDSVTLINVKELTAFLK